MPAIRRQGRRFLFYWRFGAACYLLLAALAWVFQRRFGVRAGFLFRPLGRVPFGKRRIAALPKGTKRSCPSIRFFA